VIVASALAASPALAADEGGEYIPWAVERTASAGATLRAPNGWSASLLVSSFGRRQTVEEDSLRGKASSFVNARLSRNLSKKTRVTFDVFNVFDRRLGNVDYFSTTRVWNQPGAGDNFLFNPLEPRGFRVKLRTTF
jgi:TonB dependent receptor